LTVYEGGVRVPGIVKWPGVASRDQVTDQPVITMDWTATMIAAAGAKPLPDYPLDGEDIREVLEGKRKYFDRTFFWRTRSQGAMRAGKWKYIRDGKNEMLFDLSVDEREQANFAEAEPKRLADMRSLFDQWALGMMQYKKEN
jgi:arylsulfatase A-like enzyme